MAHKIPVEYLKKLFKYNPKTGEVTSLQSKWYKRKYFHFNDKKVSMYDHQIAWALHHGTVGDSLEIDHINGNISDNSIKNLRLVTRSENCKNRKVHRDGKLVGVQKMKAKNRKQTYWQARASGKKYLGSFYTMEQAAKAVREYEKEKK